MPASPPPPPFDDMEILCVGVSADKTRCVLYGEVDMSNVDDVRAALAALRGGGHTEVLVDLTDLRFLAVSGMRALFETHLDLQAEGRRLRVVNAPPQIQRLLMIAGMTSVLTAPTPR